MKFLNLNALQTYLTLAIGLIGYALVASGCTGTAEAISSCEAGRLLSPAMYGYILGGLTFLKTVALPAIQPGGWFRNLFEPKVPVSATGATGTVTQSQVSK